MRFATVVHQGVPLAVVVDGGQAFPLPTSVADLVEAGLTEALAQGAAALGRAPIPLVEADLLLPFRPPAVRDFVTFESHVEGVRQAIERSAGVPEAWYDAPTFYFTNPHALYGPGAAIPRPASCRALDFEMEVACVVGGGLPHEGRDLTEAEAADAIFGYTIVNDWSARDLQGREMQVGLGPAKGKDFATSIGPWLVTADELPAPAGDGGSGGDRLDLDCRAYVNDDLVGQDRLSHMHWSFAEMVAYASRDSVVVPGDLLASGTTGGGGCLAELWGRRGEQMPPPIEPGDVVRLEVEGIGALTGQVRAAHTP